MKKQPFARIEEGFFNFVTDYVNQPKVEPVVIPRGVIVIWSGAANNIPAGWALCDGTSNTPDLRGRFVLGGIAGTGINSIGNRGGVSEITLQPFNLPPHTHSGSVTVSGNTSSNGNHYHYTRLNPRGGSQGFTVRDPVWASQDWTSSETRDANTSSTGDHSHTVSASGNFTTNSGNLPAIQSINILNPYYALAYIMKL